MCRSDALAYFAYLDRYVISQFVVPPESSWKEGGSERWSGGWRESEPVLNSARHSVFEHRTQASWLCFRDSEWEGDGLRK
jgi:hypothetical protein